MCSPMQITLLSLACQYVQAHQLTSRISQLVLAFVFLTVLTILFLVSSPTTSHVYAYLYVLL
jgi:hypothetical protein